MLLIRSGSHLVLPCLVCVFGDALSAFGSALGTHTPNPGSSSCLEERALRVLMCDKTYRRRQLSISKATNSPLIVAST